MTDRVGEQYGGYRLARMLGTGKAGEVYLGEQLTLNTPVVLRLLPIGETPEAREHLLAVAGRIALLDHPHLVRLFDAFIQDGLFVLVLRYTPHGNLLQYHPKGSQLPLERILPYVRDCAGALDYLHEHGLLHLDVKPENMLLGPQAEVWLNNVGLGVLLQPRTRDGTPTTFIGTPLYAAPEQFQGKAGPASDQYALAMTVYFWLTGRLPWKGDLAAIAAQKRRGPTPLGELAPAPSLTDQVARQRYDIALAVWEQMRRLHPRIKNLHPAAHEEVYGSPPHQLAPWLPPAAEAAILRALAPNPTDRFESVSAFVEALALASQPPIASPPPPGTTLFTYHENSSIHSVAWSPTGRQIASAGLNPKLQIWDATTGRRLASFPGDATRVAWSPDGRRVAVGGRLGTLEVWGAAPAHRMLACRGDTRYVRAVAWSPDGRFIACSGDGETAQVWEAVTGECVLTYHSHAHSLSALAWSPNGRRIASGGLEKTEQGWEGIIHIWEAMTGQHVLTCRGHTHSVIALAWSPENSRFVSAGVDGILRIWDSVTGDCLLTYTGHSASVVTVAWSPDGKWIVSGGSAREWPSFGWPEAPEGVATLVQVWDAATGDCLLTYGGHYASLVDAVAWSPDGTRIASAGNLNVRVWWVG